MASSQTQKAQNKMTMNTDKGIEEAMNAPDAEVSAMAKAGEKEHLIPDLSDHIAIKGGVVAANMNTSKQWIPCWLLVTASIIVLTNHIHAAPNAKYQLMFSIELLLIFMVFMCAICFLFRTMKQMM